MEFWLPVPGYEVEYQVSRFGCVRRIDVGRGTRPGTRRGRCLKPFPGAGKSKMYLRVQLSKHGVRKTIPVHLLVARAFLGPPPEDEYGFHEVHHKNTDVTNNCVSNLEYRTGKANREEWWHRHITRGENVF